MGRAGQIKTWSYPSPSHKPHRREVLHRDLPLTAPPPSSPFIHLRRRPRSWPSPATLCPADHLPKTPSHLMESRNHISKRNPSLGSRLYREEQVVQILPILPAKKERSRFSMTMVAPRQLVVGDWILLVGQMRPAYKLQASPTPAIPGGALHGGRQAGLRSRRPPLCYPPRPHRYRFTPAASRPW
jgi:hypothetical protein